MTARPLLLDVPPRVLLPHFTGLCRTLGDVDATRVRAIAAVRTRYLIASARSYADPGHALDARWYAALADGRIDWGIYDGDDYLAELWACWAIYSRRYLRGIRTRGSLDRRGSVLDDIGPVTRVVDLGCGIGYTTAALAELWPVATIAATNLEGTTQTRLARLLGERRRFSVVQDLGTLAGTTDVVFASEYFEHVPAPVRHLREVVASLSPRVLLVANSFTARSAGHFDRYDVDGSMLDGRATGKAFAAELRTLGYAKRPTALWTGRPAYWVRQPRSGGASRAS